MNTLLYYFSGTGNTRIVSSLLKETLEQGGEACELIDIEPITQGNHDFPDLRDMRIGLAFPIHAGDAPEIVYDFVRLMPMGSMNNVFILNTAADFVHFNDAAAKRVIKELEKKNYTVFYERTIVMGCNYLMAYPDAFNKQLYETAKIKVRHMGDELQRGRRRLRPAGPALKAIAALGRWGETLGARIYGRGLKSTDACSHCGKCIRECPVGNIRDERGKVRFSWHCIWCMRCVYACPEHAIKARIMRFTVIKKGYDLKKIIRNDAIPADHVHAGTKGYFKHFYRYLIHPEI